MITLLKTLSTAQANLNGRRQIAELTAQLDRAGREATTGVKADRFKSLGHRAGEVMATRARIDRLDAFAISNGTLDRRLEMMAGSLGDMRDSLQTVLNLAAPNVSSQVATGTQLQAAAKAALERIAGQVNRSYEGVALFAGVANAQQAMQPYDETNPATGRSPRGLVEAVVGAGPVDRADAQAMAAQLAARFAPGATGPDSYADTVYNGAPRDGEGRGLRARIDDERVLDYGVQADDPAFADLVRGLAMLASVDVSRLPDAGAADEWTSTAFALLEGGQTGLLAAETRVGSQRRQLEDTMDSQSARRSLYARQVDDVEGVDPYEAATRLTQVQTQLEASYAVTSRLSKLSFLNYM